MASKPLPEALAARLKARGILPSDEDKPTSSSGAKRLRREEDEEDQGGTPTDPEEKPLPSGWKAKMDKKYGKMYYYNKSLNKTQWERPTEPVVEVCDAKPRPPPPPPKKKPLGPLPPGWDAARDPASGREYYFNSHTQQTSWERPQDAATNVGMKRCSGCGGFGRGLVKEHGYCLHCSRILGKCPPGIDSLEVVENRFMTKQQKERVLAAQYRAEAREQKKPPPVVVKSASAQTSNNIGPSMGTAGQAKKVRALPTKTEDSEPLDPMDPAAYSDAPRGNWGRGIEKSRA